MSTDSLHDTADVIDPNTSDPTPQEITDVEHGDYVQPYADATPIGDEAQ